MYRSIIALMILNLGNVQRIDQSIVWRVLLSLKLELLQDIVSLTLSEWRKVRVVFGLPFVATCESN